MKRLDAARHQSVGDDDLDLGLSPRGGLRRALVPRSGGRRKQGKDSGGRKQTAHPAVRIVRTRRRL